MYETALDIRREHEVKDILETAWGMSLKKMPIVYHIDYMGIRNQTAQAWIEIKARNITMDQYPTIMLSLAKFIHGVDLYRVTKAPFIFVVRTIDGIFYHTYDPMYQYVVEYGGRTARTRDGMDLEPVVKIPTEWFRELVC